VFQVTEDVLFLGITLKLGFEAAGSSRTTV